MSLSKMANYQYKSLADHMRELQEKRYNAADQQTRDCHLHGPQLRGGICYSANSIGYSMYAPPCNGCATGQEERKKGLWFAMIEEEPKKTDSSTNTEKKDEK